MNTHVDVTVSEYIRRVQLVPRLSREEEYDLCCRWRDHGDEQARDVLIRANLRFVVAIALKYRRYGLPLADLFSEGSIGIMHALTKFEPERQLRFVTYSAYWIRACILSYIIRSWSLVGGGSGALRSKMFFRLRRERVRVTNLVGEGEQADQMLADRFNVPREKVALMLQRLDSRDVSLDAPVYDDGSTSLVATLASDTVNQEQSYSDTQVQRSTQHWVQAALKTLDPRERFIVEQRLMSDSGEEKSLAELARGMGISRERARQLEARAKRKLKLRISEMMTAEGADSALMTDAA